MMLSILVLVAVVVGNTAGKANAKLILTKIV